MPSALCRAITPSILTEQLESFALHSTLAAESFCRCTLPLLLSRVSVFSRSSERAEPLRSLARHRWELTHFIHTYTPTFLYQCLASDTHSLDLTII